MSDKKAGDQGEDALLTPQKQTFTQQLLVWVLVIAVGVLFGMGPALAILQGPGTATAGSVSQTEALEYKETVNRLNALLGQQGPVDVHWTAFARQIYTARRAEDQGLMPKGAVLDKIVSDFLAREIQGGKTVGERLAEYEKSDRGVKASDLADLLRIQTAATNLQHRTVTVPVVPTSVADDLKAVEGDKVQLAEVTLSTRSLIDEFREQAAGESATLQALYDELKTHWFRIPAVSTVTVFAADPKVVAEQVVVTDDEIAAFYEREKTLRPDWRLPDEDEDAAAEEEAAAEGEEAAEAEAPRYKPLEEVRETIVDEIKQERGTALAKELYDAFSTEVRRLMTELGVALPKDLPRANLLEVAAATAIGPETHGERLAGTVGIAVTEGVEVDDPEEAGQALLGTYGSVRFAGDLFGEGAEIGALDEPVTETDGLGLLLRLEDTREGSYQPFDEVRDQLVDYHAGRLAWPTLIERARAIAVTAADMGGDALATHFAAQEVQDRWMTTVEQESVGPLAEFTAPAEDVDGVGGETWPAIAMAGHDRPVRLAAAPSGGEELLDALPAVRLVQVTAYEAAGADYQTFARDPRSRYGFRPKTDEDWVADYRNALANHLYGKLQEEITTAMQEGN